MKLVAYGVWGECIDKQILVPREFPKVGEPDARHWSSSALYVSGFAPVVYVVHEDNNLVEHKK